MWCANPNRACGYGRQIGVADRPRRGRPAAPGVIAGSRHLQDTRHRENGILSLVRAHEPVNPFGLALLSRARSPTSSVVWLWRHVAGTLRVAKRRDRVMSVG